MFFRSCRRAPRRTWLAVEELEARVLLSVRPDHVLYHLPGQPTPLLRSSPFGLGFTPAEFRHAYGLDSLVADGAGQTIAIVDAFDNPRFVSSTDSGFAASDLHQFDLAFGLPDPPHFTKINETGGTQYPRANVYWGTEIALDVEWAHALAPAANLLLVEATDNTLENLLDGAARFAASQPGVVVVTMSFGDLESPDETTFDAALTTPAGHPGVTFVASTGDSGSPGSYPAFSPNVLAVGGTTLRLGAAGNYGSETGWPSSGGGVSQYEAQPPYQAGVVTQSSRYRTIPDVAFDANPASGVPVYDSFANGRALPWEESGGTSLAAPAWAALVAVADQARAQRGEAALDGPSQTLPLLYQLPSAAFHDVTSGNNGFAAGPGYDLVTGRGSPVANLVVAGLLDQPTGPPPLPLVAVGADAGSAPEVEVFDAAGNLHLRFPAYEAGYRGGVRVANGVLGGTPVVVTAPGAGHAPLIEVWNATTGALLTSFPAFGGSFTGGLNVGLGEVTGDGTPDLVVGEGPGGTSAVEVFNGATLLSTHGLLGKPFNPFPPSFTGGVTVAAGGGDLVVGSGPGGPPVVDVYMYRAGSFTLQKSFDAFNALFTGGVSVAVGDFNGDGHPDVIVGAGPGWLPQVAVFDGSRLNVGLPIAPVLLTSFLAYDATYLLGVRVAAVPVAGMNRVDIWTGFGVGSPRRSVRAVSLVPGLPPIVSDRILLDATFAGGAFVG